MPNTIVIITIVLGAVALPKLADGASLLEQLNLIASQSQYSAQMGNAFQAAFSLENIMATSLEMAVQSCQESFQWQHWNCPSTDFFLRRTSRTYLIDREDAYVEAISMAAILYTITKSCSAGIVAGCGCNDNSPGQSTLQCSDDPQQAVDLYQKHVGARFSEDIDGSAKRHNFKAVTTLLRKSLAKQCGCNADCSEEVCTEVLKPFGELAHDIHAMYDEGLQVMNAGANSQVMWENVPLDSLVYVKDSPNFCEPDAVPHWNGMRGRQCQLSGTNTEAIADDRGQSCDSLCYACGYQVRAQQVVKEHRCNCLFTWGYQVHCDICITVEQQYYCY